VASPEINFSYGEATLFIVFYQMKVKSDAVYPAGVSRSCLSCSLLVPKDFLS